MPYTEMGTCVPLDQATTASRCRHARECDPREEPYALARTYGSVRGARGNPGPYRDRGKIRLRVIQCTTNQRTVILMAILYLATAFGCTVPVPLSAEVFKICFGPRRGL